MEQWTIPSGVGKRPLIEDLADDMRRMVADNEGGALRSRLDLLGDAGLLKFGSIPHLVECEILSVYREACRLGRSAFAIDMIGRGFPVNGGLPHEASLLAPLAWAAQSSGLELVEFLILRGADIEAATDWGARPLALAASDARAPNVLALIRAGADLEAGDRNGATALRQAVINGSLECMLALLEAGALPATAAAVHVGMILSDPLREPRKICIERLRLWSERRDIERSAGAAVASRPSLRI